MPHVNAATRLAHADNRFTPSNATIMPDVVPATRPTEALQVSRVFFTGNSGGYRVTLTATDLTASPLAFSGRPASHCQNVEAAFKAFSLGEEGGIAVAAQEMTSTAKLRSLVGARLEPRNSAR